MRKKLLIVALLAFIFSFQGMSQCGQVSLIGEFNEWNGDHNMTRNMDNPDLWWTYLTVTAADDTDTSGFVDLKFRENHDWTVNWGSADFPSGTGEVGGSNIPVPPGTYKITFNCATAEYNFSETCGQISLIGEFNGWAGDLNMTRMSSDDNRWQVMITVKESDDTDTSGFVDLKFRENADWTNNWGDLAFPVGIGTLGGPNIPVPAGSYRVIFNCATGEYDFVETCGEISMIGEFNAWSGDLLMTRGAAVNTWSVLLTLTAEMDENGNDTIEVKFRENADWTNNWGDVAFPSGVGTNGGPNIPVLMDEIGITTDYLVTFNCATGEYNFEAASGSIGIIGAFNGWNGDLPMNRDANDPNLWTVTASWSADSEVKFRENADWTMAWGNTGWPSGVGESDNGPNIPLVAGTYDVTFNAVTAEYNFVENATVCGEIGMVGDFNSWGDDGGDFPSDLYLVRDADHPSQFSLEYNFTSSTKMYFRENAVDITPGNIDMIWGGTSLCQTGVHDLTQQIDVSGGKYMITFNCLSGDYCFQRLGNAVIAPKVFDITVDGILNESDWTIDEPISKIIEGEASDDLNEAYFGVVYNADKLYVGLQVTDAILTLGEEGEIFIDGNKSGGAYDEYDLHLKFVGTQVTVVHGPEGYEYELGFVPGATGYTVELGLPWDALGITAEEGGQIGFDIILGDDDTNEGASYKMAWNGGLENYENTSSFGDLSFGVLSCGCISIYNSTIGDVKLRTPAETPTTYVATYELFNNESFVFRKDGQSAVSWGADAWPSGTATVGGPVVPGESGRYRVTFDCLTGDYSFVEWAAGDSTAMADYTDTEPTIDGDLSEYNLQYGSDKLAVGTGPINNTVSWGMKWDANNLYVGVKVVDAVVEFTGNPWDNDAIEFYFDGDNSKDGTYSAGSFDTQLIVDADPADTLWIKADGVPITNHYTIYEVTSDGYVIEMRLGWDNFGFAPGKGRTMGFSLSNNDSDLGVGRDYQTTWHGNGNNWSDTKVLGEIQLAGGPFFVDGVDEHVLYNANVMIFPNPASGYVNIRTIGEVFDGDISIFVADITGRIVLNTEESLSGPNSTVQINTNQLTKGIYFVNVMGTDGKRAVKKLIIH